MIKIGELIDRNLGKEAVELKGGDKQVLFSNLEEFKLLKERVDVDYDIHLRMLKFKAASNTRGKNKEYIQILKKRIQILKKRMQTLKGLSERLKNAIDPYEKEENEADLSLILSLFLLLAEYIILGIVITSSAVTMLLPMVVMAAIFTALIYLYLQDCDERVMNARGFIFTSNEIDILNIYAKGSLKELKAKRQGQAKQIVEEPKEAENKIIDREQLIASIKNIRSRLEKYERDLPLLLNFQKKEALKLKELQNQLQKQSQKLALMKDGGLIQTPVYRKLYKNVVEIQNAGNKTLQNLRDVQKRIDDNPKLHKEYNKLVKDIRKFLKINKFEGISEDIQKFLIEFMPTLLPKRQRKELVSNNNKQLKTFLNKNQMKSDARERKRKNRKQLNSISEESSEEYQKNIDKAPAKFK